MKFFTLLLSVAFLAAGFEAVNGKLTAEQQHGKTSTAAMPAVKPTTAPLMTSTTVPTKAPKVQVAPTKAVSTKTTVKAHSTTKKSSSKVAEKKDDMKPTEKTAMDKEMEIEVLPIEMPATVDHPLQAEESKPLAVTGFITKNGDIYEIESKTGNGIGKIQSRQAEDKGQHICNYGAVVIYSDVPCEQVTNVKVSEVGEKPAYDQPPAKEENKPDENNDNKESEDKEDLDKQKKPARRRVSSKRRNKNKKNKLQQQQKANKKRRNGQNRPSNNNTNNNRRRLQQKRGNQNKRRRQQQNNRRDWELEEYDDEYDDDREYQKQRRRNQRKGQRRQQADRFISDYDDDY